MASAKPSEPTRTQRASRVAIPPGATAPGFRAAMVDGAGLSATFPADGAALVEPRPLPTLVDARRLASRGEDRSRMWQILSEHPRRDEESRYGTRAIEEVNRRSQLGTPEGILTALALLLLVTSNAELRARLEPQLDPLWASIPEMTMWLVVASDALLSRRSMMQLLFQYKHTTDITPKQMIDEDARRSLEAQSLAGRVATSDVVQPVFLLFSPAATGFAAPWLPHTLAFEFGAAVDLRRPYPLSLNSIYEPRVLDRPATEERRETWINTVPKENLGSLFAWWVSRLNQLYGIATDPTRFTTDEGDYDSAAQLAFLLTVERVIADLQLLNAQPQAPALTRLGTAFDLLDKLETLLGYGPASRRKYGDDWRSGAGFLRLLNADEAKPVMSRGFAQMPPRFAANFTEHGDALFATMYDELRDGALRPRVTADGVRVGPNGETTLKTTEYAGRLIRAVRNSSHGLLDQLAGREADVAASHTGALPESFPELVSLIAVALLADPEKLWSMDVWE